MTRKQHWAHINEVTFITGMRLLFWIYRLLGRWPFQILLYPVLICYMITKPAARTASKRYLQQLNAFNPSITIKPTLWNVMRHFSAFAESILDKMLLWSGLFKSNNSRYYGQKYIIDNIKQRRGGLFICAHLGNLEFCRIVAKHRLGLKLTVLIHTKHAQVFNQLLAQLDPSSQINLLQVTEMTPATILHLRDKIAQGEFIAIAGDRIPVTPNQRIAFTNFLGKRAPFPIGPYVLASLLQCPVYLLFSMRIRHSATLYIEPFRELIQLPHKNRDQALADLVAEYALRLERHCLQTPLQWFNFYDFWHLPTMDSIDETH